MNITNPYLYEEMWREHQQQMRQQIAINRMVLAEPQDKILQWTAHLLLRLGTALQQYREHQQMRIQARNQFDTNRLKEYHLSR